MYFLRWGLAGLAIMVVAGVLTAPHALGPPIEISGIRDGVEIDLRSLGEYNSSLYSIQITDLESDRVVWRVEAGMREIQVYLLSLYVGENPADLGLLEQDASLDLVLPQGESFVHFKRGGRYEIVVSSRRWFGLEFATTRTFEI